MNGIAPPVTPGSLPSHFSIALRWFSISLSLRRDSVISCLWIFNPSASAFAWLIFCSFSIFILSSSFFAWATLCSATCFASMASLKVLEKLKSATDTSTTLILKTASLSVSSARMADLTSPLFAINSSAVYLAVTAKYTAEELIAKRGEVKSAIRAEMTERLAVFNIKVVEVSVADFNFSRTFNDAIEAKQVAEQQVAKSKNELERIKVENEQKISQAKAEAEGLKIQRQEITESLLKLREIENQRKAIEKWDGKLPSVTGGTIPFIQVK